MDQCECGKACCGTNFDLLPCQALQKKKAKHKGGAVKVSIKEKKNMLKKDSMLSLVGAASVEPAVPPPLPPPLMAPPAAAGEEALFPV